MRRVLVISGGGLRGVVPATVLASLEQYTGKPCRDIFSFVAGCSTGSLIASAIAAGIPAREMVRIYVERGAEIFTPSGILSTAGLVANGYRYHSSSIHAVLESEFGAAAAWTLNDCPLEILLIAVGANGKIWYMVKDGPRNAQITGKLSLLDCATASAAAPTYFDFWYIPPLAGQLVGWCADGGIACLANPVYQACVEAFEYSDFDPKDTQVISLGTGYYAQGSVNRPAGLLDTISFTVDTLLNTADDQQTAMVRRHWPGVLQRFDWELPYAIDMADLSAIPTLVDLGRKAAAAMDWAKILA